MDKTDADKLFKEASTELQDDLEKTIQSTHQEIPDIQEVWDLDYNGNIVGLLNLINSELDPEKTQEQLTNARKKLILGTKADAFEAETQENIKQQIQDIEKTIKTITSINNHVSKLIPLFPELKNNLDDITVPSSNISNTTGTTTEPSHTEQNDNISTDKSDEKEANTDGTDTNSNSHEDNEPATSFG